MLTIEGFGSPRKFCMEPQTGAGRYCGQCFTGCVGYEGGLSNLYIHYHHHVYYFFLRFKGLYIVWA